MENFTKRLIDYTIAGQKKAEEEFQSFVVKTVEAIEREMIQAAASGKVSCRVEITDYINSNDKSLFQAISAHFRKDNIIVHGSTATAFKDGISIELDWSGLLPKEGR